MSLDPFQCDFCDSHDIKWTYPALDFLVAETRQRSAGGWAACEECHSLIERNFKDALLKRSVDTFPIQGMPRIRQLTRKLHYEFFRHRTGPATPFKLVIQ